MLTAAVMKNTGILFANDMSKDRGKAVVGNFHRLGIINSVICSYDGRTFSKVSTSYTVTLYVISSGSQLVKKSGKAIVFIRDWFLCILDL